jgi:hypothetical protein
MSLQRAGSTLETSQPSTRASACPITQGSYGLREALDIEQLEG